MAARVSGKRVCLLGCLLTASTVGTASMSADAASTVPPAYERAAEAAGVPPAVLLAVAREESGRRLNGRWIPWPWTLDVAGVPQYFLTETGACAALERALGDVPPTRIDVGLGQINFGFYGERVGEPCELLNPYRNLALAATILRAHHEPGENWLIAAGRYHRPAGGPLAARYGEAVAEQLARVLARRQAKDVAENETP
jgi:soluble lytic murein transglycosylase-like protein